MPYIGQQPATSFQSLVKQDFSVSATQNYTLSQSVTNANDIALFINNVRQEPTTAYSASGTALTLTEATAGTDDMYCVYIGKAVGTINPASGSVGTGELSATGTKNATTFLRGDNTFASSGKILQVVQTSKTDTFSTTSTSFTDVTGLSVAITPSSTSSKVLVMVSSNTSTSGGNNGMMKLVRGSTDIFIGDADSSHAQASIQSRLNDTNSSLTLAFNFLDSPSTTSATTYKLQYKVQAGTGTINKTQADSDNSSIARTASSIIAMEVGA